MNAQTFVDELSKLSPSKKDLLKHNLSDDFIDNFIKTYHCPKKSNSNLNYYSNNSILLLLQEYDCSKVQIGIISFLKNIKETANYYFIGYAEQDLLILNKISLKIEVVDRIDDKHIIWNCASNSDRFLESLLICAEYFSLVITDPEYDLKPENILRFVNLCIERSGEDESANFYKMLLGYFD